MKTTFQKVHSPWSHLALSFHQHLFHPNQSSNSATVTYCLCHRPLSLALKPQPGDSLFGFSTFSSKLYEAGQKHGHPLWLASMGWKCPELTARGAMHHFVKKQNKTKPTTLFPLMTSFMPHAGWHRSAFQSRGHGEAGTTAVSPPPLCSITGIQAAHLGWVGGGVGACMTSAWGGKDGWVLEEKDTAGPRGYLGTEDKLQSPQRARPICSFPWDTEMDSNLSRIT